MQIKFRGVRVDNGEFVFGDLLQQPTCRIVNSDGEFEVLPESIAQLAGYDIDNHELYTGDHIVFVEDRRRWAKTGVEMPPIELECENYIGVYLETATKRKQELFFDDFKNYQYVDEATWKCYMKDKPRVWGEYYSKKKENGIKS